ncbi:MAG: DNA polymerase III subunit beta [Lentisphaerae bacterium]|nr:DNA polymerase III subunit beta [Lentisphaerota bacterium]
MSKSKFFESLSTVQNIVGAKTTIPVLSNVLISAEDGLLVFTTTDLDVTMRCSCEAEISMTGKITLPVKKLTSIVRELDDGIVSVEVDEDNCAHMRCGSYRSKIIGMSADSFPPTPTTEGATTYEIDQGKFRDMLRNTYYATAAEDARAVLTGILMSFEDGKLICVATDGRRLALYESEIDFPVENNRDVVLPPRAVTELLRSLKDNGDLVISIKDKQLLFEYSGLFFSCKLIAGTYPNYKQVVINDCEKVITINREELLAVLRRISASTTTTTNAMRLNFEANILTITVNSPEVGEAVDTVAVKYDGEPLTVIFNPEFMMDPLKHLTSDDIQIELNNASSPGLIKSDIPFLYVIMPLRM